MEMSAAIDVFRLFIWSMFEILAPVLIITFLVAVIMGAIQAMMQIQEQTLSFLPKMLVMFGIFYYMAPWMLEKIVQLMAAHIENVPGMW